MSEPSERAVEATVQRALMLSTYHADPDIGPSAPEEWATALLQASHDPSLGTDRSVRLSDVLVAIRLYADLGGSSLEVGFVRAVANHIERAFTESSSPDREGENRGLA